MSALKEWLKVCEGYSSKVYKCTADANTIGWGRNLDAKGISIDEAELMLNNDIKLCLSQLSKLSWFNKQPQGVKDALTNMCFNIGITRLLGFKKMIAALDQFQYTIAATEALSSLWAKQVGQRAKDVTVMIREGK